MGARQKLNLAYINGCIVVAALIGLACQSWVVFLVGVAVLLVLDLVGGNIRASPQDRRKR
jgi:hypothetical protein